MTVESLIGGIMLALIGLFLGVVTCRRSSFLWDSMSTRLLRKYLGDPVVYVVLSIVSIVLVLIGAILVMGVVR
ncbi:MAG: hypothetical protein ACOYEU_09330 [Limnochordia bacterium]|jgi:hypothetical protein